MRWAAPQNPLAQSTYKRGTKKRLFATREINELEAICWLFTKSLTWVFSSQTDDDEVLRGAPYGAGLRSFTGNFPSAHAWQIKELVVGVEGRGSFSILPLITSRIMAMVMDCTERVRWNKASKGQSEVDCQVPGKRWEGDAFSGTPGKQLFVILKKSSSAKSRFTLSLSSF